MQHVVSRSHRIAYEVSGTGEVVLLQHGLFSRRTTWLENGFVAALAGAFTVVAVDSLGHGDSDKPSDPLAYRREARADDLAAVLDALDVERAHVVGYSMGGWIATAFAARHPARLASVSIGGWDPVGGRGARVDFDVVLAAVRSRAPELAAWIDADAEPGLRACFDALADVEGAEAALASCGAPVLLWSGSADPVHAAIKALAARLPNASLASVPGDHLEAMTVRAPSSVEAVRAFLARVASTRAV